MERSDASQRLAGQRLGTADRGRPGRSGACCLGQLSQRQLRHLLPAVRQRCPRRDRAGHHQRAIPSPCQCGGRPGRDALARLGRVRHQLGQGSRLLSHPAAGGTSAPRAVDSSRAPFRRLVGGTESRLGTLLRLPALSELRESPIGVRFQRHAHDALPALDPAARPQYRRAHGLGDVPDTVRRPELDGSRAACPQSGIDREASRDRNHRWRLGRRLDDRQSRVFGRGAPERGDLHRRSRRCVGPVRLLGWELRALCRAVRRGGAGPPVRGAQCRDDSPVRDRCRRPRVQDLPRRHAPAYGCFAGLQVRRLSDRGLPLRARRGGL